MRAAGFNWQLTAMVTRRSEPWAVDANAAADRCWKQAVTQHFSAMPRVRLGIGPSSYDA